MLILLLLTSHLNPWLVVIIGFTGSTLGRYILSLYIPKISAPVTTVSRFFSRDKRGHENDRHAVQHPVGCNLCRHFSAVGFGHYQIEKNEIGVEDDKQGQVFEKLRF